MDKGLTGQSAREMTAEIDQLTDWAVEDTPRNDLEAVAESPSDLGRVRELGKLAKREAIFSGPGDGTAKVGSGAQGARTGETGLSAPEVSAQEAITSTQEVARMVAEENGYIQSGLEGAANVIGGESQIQVEERLAEDKQDWDEETGTAELPSLKEYHDALDKQTVQEVKRVIKKSSDDPAELSSKWFKMMSGFLQQNYGRKIGDRN